VLFCPPGFVVWFCDVWLAFATSVCGVGEVRLELRFQLASHDTLLASMRNNIDTANRLLADLDGASE